MNKDWNLAIDQPLERALQRRAEQSQITFDLAERTVVWLVGIGAATLGFFSTRALPHTFIWSFGFLAMAASVLSGVANRLIMRDAQSLDLRLRHEQLRDVTTRYPDFETFPEAKVFLAAFAQRALKVDIWEDDSSVEATNKTTEEWAGETQQARNLQKKRLRRMHKIGEFLFKECVVFFLLAELALVVSHFL